MQHNLINRSCPSSVQFMVTWWPVTTDGYLESDQSNVTKIQAQFRDSEVSSSELSGTNINPKKNNFKLMMINYTGLSKYFSQNNKLWSVQSEQEHVN